MGEALRYGVVVAPTGATVDTVAERLARIEALGFDHAWMPGIPNGPDILTLLAVAGRATSRIEIGSAVVPAFPRHPAALATQALVVNDALGGRFTLGLGLSHRKVVEDHLGLSYERPVAYMRDYLAILRPLLADHAADHRGERLRTRLWLDVATTAPAAPPVMLAALGPQMLALAGRVADGVMTWMTGLATLERHIVPAVVAAAQDAGRPAPRVLVSLPVLLTHDRAAGIARANDEFALYGRLPAYRAVLAREAATAAARPAGTQAGAEAVEAIGVTGTRADSAGTTRGVGRTGRAGPAGTRAESAGAAVRAATAGGAAAHGEIADASGSSGRAGTVAAAGVDGTGMAPGEVALVGDERELGKAIGRLRDVGVTDFQATPFGDPDAVDRTVELLATRPGG